jgi:hypothetical protein
MSLRVIGNTDEECQADIEPAVRVARRCRPITLFADYSEPRTTVIFQRSSPLQSNGPTN